MIASLGVALVSFVFNERVLTRANRTLDAWQAAEYGPIPRGSDVLVTVWVRDGDDLIHADAVAGRGRAIRLRGVTIHERSGGRLESVLSAKTAAPVGPIGSASCRGRVSEYVWLAWVGVSLTQRNTRVQ